MQLFFCQITYILKFIHKNQILGEKLKMLGFIFAVFFVKLLRKFSDFVNPDDYIEKNHIKIFQTISNLNLFKKRFEFNKKGDYF